eukprot:ctg_1556.g501
MRGVSDAPRRAGAQRGAGPVRQVPLRADRRPVS